MIWCQAKAEQWQREKEAAEKKAAERERKAPNRSVSVVRCRKAKKAEAKGGAKLQIVFQSPDGP